MHYVDNFHQQLGNHLIYDTIFISECRGDMHLFLGSTIQSKFLDYLANSHSFTFVDLQVEVDV
jgi:hypothetical protein